MKVCVCVCVWKCPLAQQCQDSIEPPSRTYKLRMNVVILSDESAVAKEHLLKTGEPSTLYLMAQKPS